MSFFDKISGSFKASGTLIQLIIINVAVFLICNLAFHLSGRELNLADYTAAYSEPMDFVKHLWGVFTYMFTHLDLGHVFYNMLMLFFMSQLFVAIIGNNRLLFVYLAGGICGALLFFISALIIPGIGGKLIGASASVTAIAVAIGFYAPNMPVHLFLFGEVKLKWVVTAVFVMSSLLDISMNTGGKISHIGGAIFGMIYGLQLKNRNDIGTWFNDLGKRRSKLKVVHNTSRDDYEYNKARFEEQKSLDELLEKIHKSGYDSLSKKEKDTLHRLSKKQ
ncbi:MAG TPA: rhomboid family intramembrane serine protease [Bacteroidia bacterium]